MVLELEAATRVSREHAGEKPQAMMSSHPFAASNSHRSGIASFMCIYAALGKRLPSVYHHPASTVAHVASSAAIPTAS
jgi:hypothetical protein